MPNLQSLLAIRVDFHNRGLRMRICKFQEFRYKIGALKSQGFFGALMRCITKAGFCRYAWVSTNSQSVEAQARQPINAKCKKVFRETASEAKNDRTQLAKALATLEADDDVLRGTWLDRLTRSTRDLLNTLGTIADRKAGFRFSSNALADTTTAHGRLQGSRLTPM